LRKLASKRPAGKDRQPVACRVEHNEPWRRDGDEFAHDGVLDAELKWILAVLQSVD
jgi:hypothetical protein